MTRSLRAAASVSALVLCTACGLSSGAVGALRQQQVAVPGTGGSTSSGAQGARTCAGGGTGGAPGAAGQSGAGGSALTTGAGTAAGSTGAGSTATGTRSTATGTGGNVTTSGGGGQQRTTGSSGSGAEPSYERIGISKTQITLGLHAPQTGAAPVPLQAFQTGTKLFWEDHTVFGRKVVVTFKDDEYNPSHARLVCEQMARGAFLVVGGAGTDQIQACATDPVLQSSHTPYLSAGVTTNGVDGLFNYFAMTQTYAAQTPEVWTMANSLYAAKAKKKWAIVTEQTPNFNDVTTGMAKVLSQQHVPYCVIRTPKYFSQSDAQTADEKVRSCLGGGDGTVFLDVDPNFWIDMMGYATSLWPTSQPAWVGPGITNGEDLVAGPVCGEDASVQAAFLSPYPGLDRQPKGFTSQNNPAPDAAPQERDLEMLIYGFNEAIYHMLTSVGSIDKLTRDNFIAAMKTFHASYPGELTVLPSINFGQSSASPGHFGGTAAWQLKMDCTNTANGGGPQYVTVGAEPIRS